MSELADTTADQHCHITGGYCSKLAMRFIVSGTLTTGSTGMPDVGFASNDVPGICLNCPLKRSR